MPTTDALQQQINALTQRVDAITAPPTNYYTHRYSGEEIDNGVQGGLLLGIPSSKQQALRNIGGRPNRNLLDNAYFIGGGSQQGNGRFPINQRGKTTYTGSVDAIDRWTLIGANVASITLHPDGVYQEKISSNGYSGFQQAILLGDLEGKALTLSSLVDGELYTVTLNAGWTFVDDGTALAVVYFQNASMSLIGGSSDRLIFRFYYGGSVAPADTGMTIQAAKLELGPVQTLAYQDEDGNWQLFETPDFQEELAKCQRYLMDITPNLVFNPAYFGQAGEGGATFLVPTPVTMRIEPSVICNPDKIQIALNNGTFAVPTAVWVVLYTQGGVIIRCTVDTSGVSAFSPCDFRSSDITSKILLSAEL